VVVSTYYDLNRNNLHDPAETFRFQDAVIQIGPATGRTEAASGKATVQGVPAGTHPITVQASSLPPFFTVASPISVDVPRAEEVLVPVALPIGTNIPFRYLTSGDSITQGEGSDSDQGYRPALQSSLSRHYDASINMIYRGGGGGTSADGAARIARDLSLLEPAYVLIGWGTNDWNGCSTPASCGTAENLRSIVRAVKAANSLPCVATIVPPNVGFDSRAPESRAKWVVDTNELIKAMARQEGALVGDLHAAFMAEGSLSSLFVDHVHPNSRGYEVMARTWFAALTRPRGTAGTAGY
jgi:lysophospholipase L1-like esterase